MQRMQLQSLAAFLFSCKFLFAAGAGNCGKSICNNLISTSAPSSHTYCYNETQRITEGTTQALDVVLIVSATTWGEIDHHTWLQVAVSQLESQLLNLGIGTGTETPNRYCLIQFGGRVRGTLSSAKFLTVNGETFFSASSFVLARRQLIRIAGRIADGYQAIDFAVKNAPFRNEAGISKMVMLVTTMGRTVLDASITKQSVDHLLRDSDVLFSVVVPTNMTIQGSPVMGLSDYSTGVRSERNGSYQFVSGESTLRSASVDVISDYVTLSLDIGGLAWSMLLARVNVSSFVGGLIASHSLRPVEKVDVCEKCQCASVMSGGVEVVEKVCEVAEDQEMCSCLDMLTMEECEVLINPTPALLASSVPSSILPTPTPRPIIEVNGSVYTTPGGDYVEAVFASNRNKVNFECVLFNATTQFPLVTKCTSPYYAKNLEQGRHTLVVVAKRKGFYGGKRFDFEITPAEGRERPELVLMEIPYRANVSVGVVIEVRGQIFGGLMCSVGGAKFIPCTSPHHVSEEELGENGVLFVAVGMDGSNSPILGVRQITKPVPYRTGPIKITDIRPDLPDPFGRVKIWFNKSRSDVDCICRVDDDPPLDCVDHMIADPHLVGSGTHNVYIVCMQYSGFSSYSHRKTSKISLHAPPLPSVDGPLECDLNLIGPNPQGKLVADFSCDRPISAKCQVSGWPAVLCNRPAGYYEIDVQELSSGAHLFLLHLEDVTGRTLLKILPFTIGTAHRRCCPIIDRQLTYVQSNTTSHHHTTTLLNLTALPGNCTENEGFSYEIDWGDSSSEIGLTQNLTNIILSNSYAISSPNPGQSRSVTVALCNNPVLQGNKCCDVQILRQ